MDREATVERLRSLLADHDDVLAAWLFGSVARGRDRPDSDVDIAVLRADDRRARTLDALPLELQDALTTSLGRPVEVVDVAGAPADLTHRVLRDGVLLIDRNPERRIEFEVECRNRYFDMAPIWRAYRKAGSEA